MADLLTSGPEERTGLPRGPRRLLAGLAAVALAVGVGWQLRGDAHRTTQPAAAPTPTASGWSAYSPLQTTRLRTELVGVERLGPAGLRLLVGGPGALAAVDAGTGVANPVPGLALPNSSAVGRLLPVSGGAVAVVAALTPSVAQPGTVYLLRPGHRAVPLVRADDVVPAAQPNRFWAIRAADRQDGLAALLEVSTRGEVLLHRTVPASWVPVVGTESGLVVSRYYQDQGPADVDLVDPRSLRVVRPLPSADYVLAASPAYVASLVPGSCALGRCRVTVSPVARGTARTYSLAPGAAPGNGVFSPDGSRLAYASYGGHALTTGAASQGYVEVLDLRTGVRTRMPGVLTAEKQAADLSWTADARFLAVAVTWPDDRVARVGLWPVDGGAVRVLPPRLRVGGPQPSALLADVS